MYSNELITNVLEKAEIVLNLGNRTGIYAVPTHLFPKIRDKEFFDYITTIDVHMPKKKI